MLTLSLRVMLLFRTFLSTAWPPPPLLLLLSLPIPPNPGSLQGSGLILLLSLLCGYMCELITKHSPKIKYDPSLLSVDSVLEYFSIS